MAPKVFNNVIIGQFVLSGVPIKVYTGGRFLTVTSADDVEDPTIGFGMDENGDMIQFAYPTVEFLSVQGNKVDIETYNKGMEAKFSGGGEEEKKEEPKEDDKESDKLPKESIDMNLKNIIKEISQEEVDAEIEGAEAQIDAAKAKFKAAQAAMKDTIKKGKDKIKAAKANLKVAEEGVVNEDHGGYTFGVGDIVKNKNTSCPHHGSMGVVKKVMDLPNGMGKVAIYTVMNSGDTYKPGMSLTKTVDQLEPIQKMGN
jgi:hypothetical protein